MDGIEKPCSDDLESFVRITWETMYNSWRKVSNVHWNKKSTIYISHVNKANKEYCETIIQIIFLYLQSFFSQNNNCQYWIKLYFLLNRLLLRMCAYMTSKWNFCRGGQCVSVCTCSNFQLSSSDSALCNSSLGQILWNRHGLQWCFYRSTGWEGIAVLSAVVQK